MTFWHMGFLVGYTMKGFRGCPICKPNTWSRRSQELERNVFDHQAKTEFLADHHMPQDTINFQGDIEMDAPI